MNTNHKKAPNHGTSGLIAGLIPDQQVRITREGVGYVVFWFILLGVGMYHQINLILLISGLAAGPLLASWFASARMLSKLEISRRITGYVFAGERLAINYSLQNNKRGDALALVVNDSIEPVDSTIPGARSLPVRLFFARVPSGSTAWHLWSTRAQVRGKYRFRSLELVSRHPYGLLQRKLSVAQPSELIVYPAIGKLSRRWSQLHRESTQTKRGQRHDRSSQQEEYHGLRDYRPDDSPRWVHWRTSARLGRLMVKEFEQQHEQDLALLLDPWIPRTKVTPEQREAVEEMIRFAATVCVETCRHSGRRLLLGWTGPSPGLRQGPATVKLLHGLLEQLAILRPSSMGEFSVLFDALPPPMIRDAILIAVSSRPVNLLEEAEKSLRLSGAGARSSVGRIRVLDVSRGDLADFFEYDSTTTNGVLKSRRETDGVEDGLSADSTPWPPRDLQVEHANPEVRRQPRPRGAGANGKGNVI